MQQTSTHDLLERFLWELSEQQKYLDLNQKTTFKAGSLQISMGYLIDRGEVEVSVIQATELVARGEREARWGPLKYFISSLEALCT